MPKSRIRRKTIFTPPPAKQRVGLDAQRWVAPAMVTFFLIGLLWIVVFYITRGDLPIESIDNWNLVVGFGFISVGFLLSTKWK